jgi:2-polyprenyl-3-methyl-5-hydroxy-6-metoxy-1,4-benzoquinol methylase
MSALEYGAGTGITSLLLREELKEIILMDNSREMVRVMNDKIAASGAGNMRALQFDLEHSDYTGESFDLVFTQMVLHHVNDVAAILKKFSIMMRPGAYLAIADLCPEDGSFHGEGFTGHRGFNTAELEEMLAANGFSEISCSVCFVIDRKISETQSSKFNVFLMTALKN